MATGSSNRLLNTSGLATLGVGICARCGTKRSLTEFGDDPDTPGLRVCRDKSEGCADDYDPYKLPPRRADKVVLNHPRPDVSIALTPAEAAASDVASTS